MFGETTNFTVICRSSLNREALQEITVLARENGNQKEKKFLLAKGEVASVAIPMESAGDGPSCLTLDGTPRLFLGFPMIGTEEFSFPAVINSFRFTPTEDRDGVFLGISPNKPNTENQKIIEEACDLQVRLIQFAAESGSRNIYTLSDIPPIPEAKWLRKDWLQERLELHIRRVRKSRAILCELGTLVPKDSILPIAEEGAAVKLLWDLLNDVDELRQRLPKRDQAAGWCDTISSWKAIRENEDTPFDEAINGWRLATYVAEENERRWRGIGNSPLPSVLASQRHLCCRVVGSALRVPKRQRVREGNS